MTINPFFPWNPEKTHEIQLLEAVNSQSTYEPIDMLYLFYIVSITSTNTGWNWITINWMHFLIPNEERQTVINFQLRTNQSIN